MKTLFIPTEKGHFLSVNKFVPSQSNRKSMIISSATGVPQGFYRKFAQFYASLGYRVYTFDYSGIGASGSGVAQLKKNVNDLKSWGSNDQAAVVKLAKEEAPDSEIVLLAHSVGGQLLGFNPNYALIDAVILVGCQSGFWKYYRGYNRLKMWTFWYLMIPLLTPICGYFPAKKVGLFENIPKNMAYEWMRWGRQKEYMMHFYTKEDYFFNKIKAPMLVLSFPKDDFAPKKAADWLAAQYTNARVTRWHYLPASRTDQPRHFGYFKEAFKETLWIPTHKWICSS